VNPSKVQFQHHVRYYWFAWATVLCAFAVVRFILPPRLIGGHFNLGDCYVLGVWIPIMLLNFYEGRRLMGYLRKHHPAKWAELTTFLGFGPGWVNGFRSVPWLYSADTLSDPVVAQLKGDYRQFICWSLVVLFTFPIFFIIFNS
jgi:hypothetical protein